MWARGLAPGASVSRVSSYAAFLKGMNLGRRRITNQELREAFAALGFAEVHPFRASGNVAFACPQAPSQKLAERIERALAQALAYPVPTFVRSSSEVAAICARAPFAEEHLRASSGKVQVAILGARPPAAVREEVMALSDERDRLTFGERELYWLPAGGVSDSDLDLKAIERLLGAMTLRTKGTLEQLAAKHF